MTSLHDKESNLHSVEHLLLYYDQQVLAAYRNQPHRYRIEADYFEGELRTTTEYYRELEAAGKTSEAMSVRFGYRSLRGGDLAIVAWAPDLVRKSEAHIQQWSGFRLSNPEWTTGHDERFDKWVRRYIEGDWDVDNGPLYHLGQTVKIINSLTIELVGVPLYKHEIDDTLSYPAADNTHRYQDSHGSLYGYLIDGLDKKCILALASRLGRRVKTGDKKTIEGITMLFPCLKASATFIAAFDLVSEQRRLASHGVRPGAKNFPAFSQFTKDLYLCLDAIKELRGVLEHEFQVNGEELREHHTAKEMLPEIDRLPHAHYSIVQASRMIGKTVERVEFGFRKKIEGVHESEALIIHFTDGSIMGLDTGSNAGNLACDENGPHPDDFHVDFMVRWVPELPKVLRKPPGA
jgi:hypothetical protein